VLPFWEEKIVPEIRAGKRALVVAHGNTLRALVMHLDGLSEKDVLALHVPTAEPLVYDLAADASARRRHYLRLRPRLLDLAERVARGRLGGAS
jgi:2,3-bisphosphoglycerate-dependent phosphoglycerate mutase